MTDTTDTSADAVERLAENLERIAVGSVGRNAAATLRALLARAIIEKDDGK